MEDMIQSPCLGRRRWRLFLSRLSLYYKNKYIMCKPVAEYMRLWRCLFLPLLGLPLAQQASAAFLNANIPVAVYTDFGQNKGRYQTGVTNALLRHLHESGVPLPPVDGVSSGTMSQEMINFESMVDKGNAAGIGYNFIATAQHVGLGDMGSPTFSAREVGAEHAIHYASIEYSDQNDLNNDRLFRLTPETDYKISRLSKLITDVTTSSVYRPAAGEVPDLEGAMLHGSCAGDTWSMEADGTKTNLTWGQKSPDGWMMDALGAAEWTEDGFVFGEEDKRGCTDDSFLFQTQVGSWGAEGVTETQPLPMAGYYGDSGSPVWIYNADAGRYEYLGALEAADLSKTTQGTGAGNWTCETMESFDREILCGAETTICLQSVVHQDSETLTDTACNASTTPWRGTVTREDGTLITDFIGVQDGLHTWLSLNEEMDKEAWYAYGNEYLNASTTEGSKDLSYADLFMTENLVFRAGTEEEVLIRLEGNVDLGIGYVEFSAGERERASFVIASGGEGDYLLHSAGYVVGQGVEVTLTLTNEADYAREWRKVGGGRCASVVKGITMWRSIWGGQAIHGWRGQGDMRRTMCWSTAARWWC